MKRTLTLFITLACILICFAFPATAQGGTSGDFACDYSALPKDGYYLNYGSTSVARLTAAEAEAQNVPAGYQNDVLLVTHNNTSMGLLLDFSALQIPYKLIETLTFRVYVCDDGPNTAGYPEVRIIKPGSGAWVMRYNVENTTNQWVDVTLNCNKGNFQSGRNFSDLSVNGLLDRFELSVRANQGKQYFYIDSISYTLIEDTTPPEIRYDGESVLYYSQDSRFDLPISAYDAEEAREVTMNYEWSDPHALNDDGTLNAGQYTLTAFATNFTGLRTERVFTVTVGEKDVTPPEISIAFDKMHLLIGTIPMLSPEATDNTGHVKLTSYWSGDALDRYGRLTEGIHLYTVRAVDLSGNEAVKTVIVYVSDEESLGNYVIDEQTGIIIDNRPSNEGEEKNPVDAPVNTPPSNENTDNQPNEENDEKSSDFPFGFLFGLLLGFCFGLILFWRLFRMDSGWFKKKPK